ncbi:hypothetical protein RF11_14458 [Thelohanellus kitauei]|uniref:Uncharacterized protein n=1 Tax=Thelohanellus kitauei TaxID=669202 RepID=A0A0C2MN53_THEKT|nr:hypothetical protein RF11_14458 [Thelohanellus kitauei]
MKDGIAIRSYLPHATRLVFFEKSNDDVGNPAKINFLLDRDLQVDIVNQMERSGDRIPENIIHFWSIYHNIGEKAEESIVCNERLKSKPCASQTLLMAFPETEDLYDLAIEAQSLISTKLIDPLIVAINHSANRVFEIIFTMKTILMKQPHRGMPPTNTRQCRSIAIVIEVSK